MFYASLSMRYMNCYSQDPQIIGDKPLNRRGLHLILPEQLRGIYANDSEFHVPLMQASVWSG